MTASAGGRFGVYVCRDCNSRFVTRKARRGHSCDSAKFSPFDQVPTRAEDVLEFLERLDASGTRTHVKTSHIAGTLDIPSQRANADLRILEREGFVEQLDEWAAPVWRITIDADADVDVDQEASR